MLIHYIGDIHQPLHASSRYTKDFPDGDEGGNGFLVTIKGNSEITNLHALWDSVLLGQVDDMKLPLSQSNWESLGTISSRLRSTHNITSLDLSSGSSSDWANESFKIVESEIYSTIFDPQAQEGTASNQPTEAYI